MESPSETIKPGSAFVTLVLACVVAVLGILFLSFFPHWYEVVVFSSALPQTTVNALGPTVFFLIAGLVGVVNPMLRAWAPRAAFESRELFLIVSVWLFT